MLPGGDAMWAPPLRRLRRDRSCSPRRAETTFALQSRYNEWEVSNPVGRGGSQDLRPQKHSATRASASTSTPRAAR